MKTLNGGAVRSGYYLNAKTWEMTPVANDGQVLPEGKYVELSTWTALMLMPILGGLFVVFMPFIGLYLFFKHVGAKLAGYVSELFHAALAPTAAVGTAHFTGSEGEKGNAEKAKLEKLEEEIAEKRK